MNSGSSYGVLLGYPLILTLHSEAPLAVLLTNERASMLGMNSLEFAAGNLGPAEAG